MDPAKKRHHRWWLLLLILPLGALTALYIGLAKGDHRSAINTAHQPDCQGTQLLSFSPVKPEDVATIVPLGNLAPPGHVVPTVHMYYVYHQQPNSGNFPVKTTLYAPADLTVTKIQLEDNMSSAHPFNSYRLDFSICKQVTGYFYHPITLNDALTAAIQPPYDHTTTSFVGNGTEHSYAKNVNIKVKAGEVIGTGGGGENLPDGLDFGLSDSRVTHIGVNPKRWSDDTRHYVCSLDYLPADISAALYSNIGGFDLQHVNPGEPKCGTVYQDVAGTAQGDWFATNLSGNTFWDGNSQLALVHSNLNHAVGVFSLGNDIKNIGVSPDTTYTFTPRQSGLVNVDFNLVKPGEIYCYETTPTNTGATSQRPMFLIQLTDATTLKIGRLDAATCGSGPWSLGQSLTYFR